MTLRLQQALAEPTLAKQAARANPKPQTPNPIVHPSVAGKQAA